MTGSRKIVALAEITVPVGDKTEVSRRTAIFDQKATIGEVFDWLRFKRDQLKDPMVKAHWWNASLSLYEDEGTAEPDPISELFQDPVKLDNDTSA